MNNFREVSRLVEQVGEEELNNEQKLKYILKELRDLSSMGIAPALFSHPANLTVLLILQKNTSLELFTQKCVH